ncbi:hypothetical protein SAMN05444007_11139 [Cribrihabitans marinus]|uniref:Uncharacterized protein n=1 Tax=Cribrihabitans marinus TaxID=1227549 RepID=A0A1H7DER3_9RHOB|nr:hypothetical protein [Cribrihabitans marinus]GGH38759.1 hypothetical protein GCM10010973_34230 [Cribrihabitans marinus]SEK00178.1 hypothetical protein SAMN05444007_11139 [Cribrihabitans marinus]
MVVLVILAIGVLAYFIWRARTSSLTRACRWRQDKAAQQWRCAYCGAVQPGLDPPRACHCR